jgi:HEPN domain-containing protein
VGQRLHSAHLNRRPKKQNCDLGGQKLITDDEFEHALRTINEELKADGIPPHGRSINALIKFGQRFGLSMPFTKPQPGMPPEVAANWPYSERIFQWFEDVYAERNKLDPSAGRKVAVLADGDMWEIRLPMVWGMLIPVVEKKLTPVGSMISTVPRPHNISNSITGITDRRLQQFTQDDINEVYGHFVVGLDVCEVLDRFRKHHQLFTEAQSDLATAVSMLTAQSPNYGQSRWASLQFAEKFMKGLIHVIGTGDPKQRHDVRKLHGELTKSIMGLHLENLIENIECNAAVRYCEVPSTRAQAYAAHKSSLLLIRALGSVKYSQS